MEKEKVHNFGGRFLYFCVKVEKEFRFQIYGRQQRKRQMMEGLNLNAEI